MKQDAQKRDDIIVIGGGIVGLAIAEKLSSEGKSVLLIEKEKIAAGASAGNAAGLAFSDIMPLASPGILFKAIRWLLDPLGPFTVVPQDLPKTLPWLTRFMMATRPAKYRRSITVQASLMHLAGKAMDDMLARTGLDTLIHQGGALHLYESERDYQKDLKNWDYRRRHSIDFECYEKDDLHQFQPGLAKNFVAGIFVPHWKSVSNPLTFCKALHDILSQRPFRTVYSAVRSVEASESGVTVQTENGPYDGQKVIIAAGPWSSSLARQLGDMIPLIGERGYNTTFPKSALTLTRTLVFPGHGFVISPLADGIRVGGASEIARLGRKENFNRSKAMVSKAQKFVPALRTQDAAEWMGARPSIPDSLPVIGFSSRSKNILYAFGHGHLGLTQSAATGQLVSDLINKTPPSIDLAALSPHRF
ncbi:MAG: FAD-binding oxidoreductase [Sneathiella sp.]